MRQPSALPLPAAPTSARPWRALLLGLGLAGLGACAEPGKGAGGLTADIGGQAAEDGDGDGFVGEDDCNDQDAAVNGGAVEVCDGVDNDCDGEIDEDVVDTWYADADGDGFGDPAAAISACEAPLGAVPSGTDCDDADPQTLPGGDERCDEIDNDCDGVVDEDVRLIWFADADGDGFGDAAAPVEDCDPGPGVVGDDTDCDDAQASVYPEAPELCDELDNDCDSLVDEGVSTTYYADRDGDGYGLFSDTIDACSLPVGYADDAGDCDDAAATVHPDADELCNGVDDDCDGELDEDSAVDALTFYADADGDGFGDDFRFALACAAPPGFVSDNTDCDDAAVAVSPAADEVCNGLDDDCDTVIDDADADLVLASGSTFWADLDRDGYGDPAGAVQACLLPAGAVANDDDCDDGNNRISPAAAEVCNGLDDDCDAATDDADPSVDRSTGGTWYADADVDGFGAPGAVLLACSQPAGSVTNALDCDDARAAVRPTATEVCNGIDDDCDALTDDSDPGVSLATGGTWYADGDRDGFGAGAALRACLQPANSALSATDCDDTRAAVNPSATEVCNGRDDDCDSLSDDADTSTDLSTGALYHQDSDRDGYGGAAVSRRYCVAPSGWVSGSSDCDDSLAAVNPAATEVCNGRDDDCDSLADDLDSSLDSSTGTVYYRDADSDGYGSTVTSRTCSRPTGYVSAGGDCNDATSAVSPSASERCNSVDDDCDGATDESSAVDAATWYRDADGDGYGTSGTTTRACTRPTGYVSVSTDCADSIAAVYPGADETCNSRDDDCDGTSDESWVTTNFSASTSSFLQLNGTSTVTSGYLQLSPTAGGNGSA
ncbi:MAG: hypothetical protein RL071_1344, partial [Pseudomonadota bacterium]